MIRLYIKQTISPGALIALDESRAHYLRHVMRASEGDRIMAFNEESGEWEASLRLTGKRSADLAIGKQVSAPRLSPDVWLAFAAIKNKSELVVEKATELGAREIHPIVSQYSVVKNINMEKLEAHAIEASEQCERHDVPAITPHKNLGLFLGAFPKDRLLLYGDETGKGKKLPELLGEIGNKKTCILVGPEGGFSEDEHRMLKSMENAKGFGLGPRILRADTAAVAALSCLMAAMGDWDQAPHFKGAA